MGSVSDTMLASGVMPNLDAIHGEAVTILDGVDAGRTLWGIVEHEQDVTLNSDMMPDPRGRRMLRFTNRAGNLPSANAKRLFKVQIGNKKYSATKQDFGSFLSTDYELTEIAGVDT